MLISALLIYLGIVCNPIHSEVVAEVRIDNYENEVFVEVALDKRLLTTALIMEADCSPQTMLSVCGGEYLSAHLALTVNDSLMKLHSPTFEMFQKQVLFRYYLGDMGRPVRKLTVESDYMFDYHKYSIVKVKVGVDNTTKSYNITNERRKIQAIIQ
ncbi:hypothetical protein [Marinoscillum sp.]|uniref:hypothetical protein n=1 Tax=Marinoscillum sp. TaxID=2024838 RepID=UPI003BA9A4B5